MDEPEGTQVKSHTNPQASLDDTRKKIQEWYQSTKALRFNFVLTKFCHPQHNKRPYLVQENCCICRHQCSCRMKQCVFLKKQILGATFIGLLLLMVFISSFDMQWSLYVHRKPAHKTIPKRTFVWTRQNVSLAKVKSKTVELEKHDEFGYQTCNFRQILSAAKTYADLKQLEKCNVLVYNRVPKCASRTILCTFREIAKVRKFELITTTRENGMDYFQTLNELTGFVGNFTHHPAPFLYSRHMHFVDFERLGFPSPVYINVIRDPLERLISHYYYNQYGSVPHPDGVDEDKMTLDQCVRKGLSYCLKINTALPFFCGHDRKCRLNNAYLVPRAKKVVMKNYLTVGLTEDLHAFMEVLEGLMPHFFKNATHIFDINEMGFKNKTQTAKKLEVNEETKIILKGLLAYEYEFYSWVKQRFYTLLRKVKKLKQNHVIEEKFSDLFKVSKSDLKISDKDVNIW